MDRRATAALIFLCLLAGAAGGVLWALSPLGVHLSEIRYKTPNVFWKLFPAAPLLMLPGLLGLRWRAGGVGLLGKLGFWMALLGGLLAIAGAVAKFWLHTDDWYIMSAPGYRAFRLGLLLLAGGAVLFGVGVARVLPVWGALPFAVGALAGLIAVSGDLGSFGAALWVSFGVAWAWMCLAALWAWLWPGKPRATPLGKSP